MTSGASATSSAMSLRVMPASVPSECRSERCGRLTSRIAAAPHKPRYAGLPFRIVHGRVHEHADAPRPLRLLRAHRERPRRRAAKKTNELTSPHILTQAPGTALYRLKRVFR